MFRRTGEAQLYFTRRGGVNFAFDLRGHTRWRVNHRPDDGGSKCLRNIAREIPDYTVLHPLRTGIAKYWNEKLNIKEQKINKWEVKSKSRNVFIWTVTKSGQSRRGNRRNSVSFGDSANSGEPRSWEPYYMQSNATEVCFGRGDAFRKFLESRRTRVSVDQIKGVAN